jgi:mRNA-degrading endonuclease HigB of HigAB toxin-antitoxin module
VRKHVAVLIMAMNCIVSSAYFGQCKDCKNMHGMDNTIFTDRQIYPESM